MSYYATNLITGDVNAAALAGQLPFRHPVDIADSQGDLQCVTGVLIFASGVNLALNDVIELAVLPADHVPVDFILDNDDFDSATTAQFKLGVMTGNPGDTTRAAATVGQEGVASGSTLLQSAAFTRCALGTFNRVSPATSDRSIGMAITAAPTNPATIRRLNFVFFYRWSSYGY